MDKLCLFCGKKFIVPNYRSKSAKYCSRSCLNKGTFDKREPYRLAKTKGIKAHNNKQIEICCKYCKKRFYISPSRKGKRFFCSRLCHYASQRKPPKKYARVTKNKKRQPLHRYVMEQHLGRKLQLSEQVHHIDHDTHNNHISNLQLLNVSEHAKETAKFNRTA